MELTSDQIELLKELMENSAQKGNLANSGLVLENGVLIDSAESLVVTNHDASAHSERMLVTKVGQLKGSNYTPGLAMVTVVEPCLMCMSACSQAGYSEIAYIIPASRYVTKMPWITDTTTVDKAALASQFSSKIMLIHLNKYEEEFCRVFEHEMRKFLK
ncbi:MAG: hypothetical protein WC775_00640 [Patescibacteria group bacterium]|jgi:tRNA(Arg) A34 adenosine deaminase TadA